MATPSIDDLEQFVIEHRRETWRSIQDGLLKEFNVTKSSNWIVPRKKAALIAESLVAETDETLEAEIPEEEVPEEPPEIEKDPKIVSMNSEIKILSKEIQVEETKKKLLLARSGRTQVEDLLEDNKQLQLLREEDATFTAVLKAKLEEMMSRHRNYYGDATCPICEGAFFWKADTNLLNCFVCEKSYKLPMQ